MMHEENPALKAMTGTDEHEEKSFNLELAIIKTIATLTVVGLIAIAIIHIWIKG